MLIGILSDSHGYHRMVRKATILFDRLGVDRIIHCGDVGGIPVFDELIDRTLDFVWGNTDDPGQSVYAYLDAVGITPPGDAPLLLSMDGRKLAVFHGHENAFQRPVADLDVDYVLHGHTHEPRNETVSGVRIINPGALHRAKRKTVATLDLRTGAVMFHEIRDSP